ncbi:MAG: hypothetical protein AB7K14_09705 [Lysobacterales bacterium]
MRHRVEHVLLRLLLAAMIGLLLATPSSAQEICGLSSVQFDALLGDGFESLATPNAAASAVTAVPPGRGKAGALGRVDLGRPLGHAARIQAGVAPTILILSPAAGASLPGRAFEVRGTFTGPLNTGITVNGVAARTFGNQWVSTGLRPPAGSFDIDAVAHTFDGQTASAARSLTLGNAEPPLELRAASPGNLAPATIGFNLRFPAGAVVSSVQIDFDDDGSNDYSGPLAGAPSGFFYANPGLYTARAEAVVDGNPAASEASVVIADVVANRLRACAVYGELRASLTANDLEATLATFIPHQREALRPFFTTLGDNRPVFATRLGTIANGYIGVDGANLRTLRIEAGQPVAYPFEVAADPEGVWRINSF